MAEKSIKARVIQKHDTAENWLKATNFIPKQGELIIYDTDSTHDIERFKIGDGTTTVNNLPFRSIDGGYDALTEILPETTLNFTDNGLTLTDCPPIEVGKTYTVTFYRPNTDPIEYELVGKEASIGSTYRYIGNEAHTWGGTNTGEPFIIYSYDDDTAIVTYIYISSSETLPCTYNIKIKAVAPVKIDEKYLDIKNTNIVNGSAVGSLRTIASTKEDSSYSIGEFAFAEGYYTIASGYASHAEGYFTKASGLNSHTEGNSTTASGYASHAEGNSTIASGYASHAEGHNTIASGDYSHAEGNNTTASGSSSHAEGYFTKASGLNSHTEGNSTTASGYASHAEGSNTKASGSYSHAEGVSTIAASRYQHVQGIFNIEDTNNTYADIIGNGENPIERSNASTLDWNGNAWYAGDVYVGSTSGTNKDEGSKKLATEEYVNSAISSSEGSNVQADWQQNDETANDYVKNRPGGYDVLTEIVPETTLNFTTRDLTFTNCPPIEVGIKYIVTFDGTEYELVGKLGNNFACIGNESLTWGSTDTGEPFIIYYDIYGDNAPWIWISSSTTLPCTRNIKIKAITPVKINEKYLDIKNTNIVDGSAKGSLRTIGSSEEGSGYEIGKYAFAEGYHTQASGIYSHAEGIGTTASGGSSHSEGSNTTASGGSSHSEGSNTTASGTNSHAEGNSSNLFSSVVTATNPTNNAIITAWGSNKFSLAKGNDSHVEGRNNLALGNASHAEGYYTIASGSKSHAEGMHTEASGSNSHAEGYYTTASSNHQHVQGRYNIADATTYADIIGNGSSDTERSNAATVDWQGNAWYAGDVYVGSTSGKNKDEGSKKLATEEYTNNAINKKIEVSETAPTEEENKIWLQPMTTNVGAVDYIIEQGISGIWTYRKWNSGIAECWGSYNLTIPITTEYGGNHYYGVILERDFPTGLFLETPHTMLSITDDSGNVFALKRHSSRTTTGAMYALSLVSMANDTVYVDIEAKGKWK